MGFRFNQVSILLAAILLSSLLPVQNCFGFSGDPTGESLKGIAAVNVRVYVIGELSEIISEEEVRTSAVTALKKSIQTVTATYGSPPGGPLDLYEQGTIDINLYGLHLGGTLPEIYFYRVTISFTQSVTTWSNRNRIFPAITWQTEFSATRLKDDVEQELQKTLSEQLGYFIKAYKASNSE